VVIPPGAGLHLLDVLNGLVLAGGGDLDPALYGRTDVAARDVDLERDATELALARAARNALLPVLGVCRGAQVFAVMDGGTLVPDLGERHVIPPGTGTHAVRTTPGSLARRLLGARAEVGSLHHQSVRSAGPGWVVTARTDDGVVEALEWTASEWPALGVQWHPELDHTGPRVFGWLVAVARDVIRSGCSSDQLV
jgi:putative glutamine amidotransferase